MNEHFLDMLSALSDAGADYLVVSAYALAVHGHPRATGDIDVWVRPTSENATRVWSALEAFGAPRRNVTVADFHAPNTVFQIGMAPNRIDILTSISGVDSKLRAKSKAIQSEWIVNLCDWSRRPP